MRKQSFFISFILIIFGLFSISHSLWAVKKKDEVLFPRREYVKRHSEYFFKQVNMTQPLISKVVFFAKSNAYLSAYLAFSPYLEKQEYFSKHLPAFESKNKDFLLRFQENQKELKLENYPQYLKKANTGKSVLAQAILYTLVDDYRGNRLSGDSAFRLWNVLLKLVESAYRDKTKTIDNAELLNMASHLVFFKKVKKWKKKANKLQKQLVNKKQ